MPLIPKIIKGPNSAFSATLDFSGWPQLQGDDPDTLSSATASVSPSGLTIDTTPTVDADTNYVSISLAADGTDGTTYRITCLATTADGDILDGYLDVLVTSDANDGAVIYPSQFGPYIDTARCMELLYDDGDSLLTDEDGNPVPPPGFNTIDGNERAFFVAQSAWRSVIQAATRGEVYTIDELTDLANDRVRGQDLIELCADLFWHRLIKRRRYVQGEPQAQDANIERAEAMLEALRRGERIFNLEGVINSSTGSAYTNVIGEVTALDHGRLGMGDRDFRDNRFWACTNDDRNDPNYSAGGGSCGGC